MNDITPRVMEKVEPSNYIRTSRLITAIYLYDYILSLFTHTSLAASFSK